MSNDLIAAQITALQDSTMPYVIIPDIFCNEMQKLDVEKVTRKAIRSGTAIFQQKGLNDRKRKLIAGMETAGIEQFQMKVSTIMNIVDSRLHVSPTNVIASMGGCVEQRPHYDFNPKHMEMARKSYLVVAAIMPGSQFIGYIDNHRVVLNLHVGAALIARGDFIHAGAGYNKDNVRLHWYVDYPKNKRVHSKIYVYDVEYKTVDPYALFYKRISFNLEKAHRVKRVKKAALKSKMEAMRNKKATNF